MRVRPAVLAAGAALGGLVLGGCEKPTPLVTVTSGTTSVHTEAACYAGDGGEVSERACRAAGSSAPEVGVQPQESVAVGVDTELADAGWRLSIDGRPVTTRPLDTTFFRFGLSEQAFARGPLELQVSTADGRQLTGLWLVRLTPG